MSARAALAVAMVVALVSPVAAQPMGQPKVIQLMPVELRNGTLVSVQRQVMEVREMDVTLGTPLTTQKRPSPKSIAKQPVPRAKPGGQEPFEVADGGGKVKPSDPPAKPAPAGKEPPASKDQPPAADGDPAETILPVLSLKSDELKDRASLSITFEAGDPLLFIPAKEEAAENLRKRFGEPKEIRNVQGSLPVGDGGARKDVRWQVWTYGSLRTFVDEAGKTRYFHLGKK